MVVIDRAAFIGVLARQPAQKAFGVAPLKVAYRHTGIMGLLCPDWLLIKKKFSKDLHGDSQLTYICPKVKQTSDMTRKEIGEKIAMYGLTNDLRAFVASRRKSLKRPSRDTVWRAFNTDEESPLLKLIEVSADKMVKDHEKEFGGVDSVESDRERAVAA